MISSKIKLLGRKKKKLIVDGGLQSLHLQIVDGEVMVIGEPVERRKMKLTVDGEVDNMNLSRRK